MGEEIELELGETKILGVYRISKTNSIRPYDVQDPEDRKQMLQDDRMDLFLKMKVVKAEE